MNFARTIDTRTMRIIVLITALALLTACGKDGKVQGDANSSERQFYEASQRSLRTGNYQVAIGQLQQLEARFPFGRYAEQAQLELIYAYYRSVQPEAARAAADRFIRLHPQHPNVDYAYYLKGMVSFEEDQNFLETFLPFDPAKRDPGRSRDAFGDFAELISRYPDSKYAPDAQQRMVYLRNLLAEHEIVVARYYIKRGAYIAAANRGRHVFENYPSTPSVPDALAVMVEAYTNLDMTDLANESLMVLQANFTEHRSIDRNGKFKASRSANSDRSWLNIITFGVVG
jgi:outer membrane protein assembly factor BamD